MSTKLHVLLDYARVALGDLAETKYKDDTILSALRVTTDILAMLGYDKGYTSDPDSVSASLTGKEKALWGLCAANLLQDPEAQKAALEAVSVRTLGTSYSTEGKARFLEAASSTAWKKLMQAIRSSTPPFVSTRDNLDFDTLP